MATVRYVCQSCSIVSRGADGDNNIKRTKQALLLEGGRPPYETFPISVCRMAYRAKFGGSLRQTV